MFIFNLFVLEESFFFELNEKFITYCMLCLSNCTLIVLTVISKINSSLKLKSIKSLTLRLQFLHYMKARSAVEILTNKNNKESH